MNGQEIIVKVADLRVGGAVLLARGRLAGGEPGDIDRAA